MLILISLTSVSVLIALIAIWYAYNARVMVNAVLSYSYLESIVQDAIDEWKWEMVAKEFDVDSYIGEIDLKSLTTDAAMIAWHYQKGSFEDRLREATIDLLDASFV